MQIRQSIASSNLARHSRDSWNIAEHYTDCTDYFVSTVYSDDSSPIIRQDGFIAYLAFRILALLARVPLEDFILVRQSYGRCLAIKRAPRIVVDLPAGPAYVKHVLLAQSRVFIEDGNYCPLRKAMSHVNYVDVDEENSSIVFKNYIFYSAM